jgi:hypothetical protein
VFGAKDKPAKPAQERRCPFLPLAGGSLACVQDKCAVWQDEAGACAFNVLARAVTATERPEA